MPARRLTLSPLGRLLCVTAVLVALLDGNVALGNLLHVVATEASVFASHAAGRTPGS